jgi:hypothetical protein
MSSNTENENTRMTELTIDQALQQGCDFPITIPPILLGQPDHRQAKFVVIWGFGLIAQT